MILFRCDASPQLGLGHLIRCRALAYALRKQGQQCMMVGPPKIYMNAEDTKLFVVWETLKWESVEADARCVAALVEHFSAAILVLDDYRVDVDYQLLLRSRGLRWLQFETRTDRAIWADIVLNANPAVNSKEYASVLCNPNTKLLLGPHFAMLRPEFSDINLKKYNPHIARVMVTFGGGDDLGLTLFVLATLLPVTPKHIEFVVMSGECNPRNSEITSWIQDNGESRVIIEINPRNVASLIVSCDLAIMAGGSTIYEAACCGLNMILIATAENQINQSNAWGMRMGIKYLGLKDDVSSDKLLDAFFLFYNNKNMYEISNKNEMTVDSKGAERVCESILKLL